MLPCTFLRARAIGLMPMIDQVYGLSVAAYIVVLTFISYLNNIISQI